MRRIVGDAKALRKRWNADAECAQGPCLRRVSNVRFISKPVGRGFAFEEEMFRPWLMLVLTPVAQPLPSVFTEAPPVPALPMVEDV